MNRSYAAGDYEGARRDSRTARNLNTIAIIGGLIMMVVMTIVYFKSGLNMLKMF